MVDNISKEERSATMAKVRSKNTKPEMIVRSMMFRMGYRFRVCQSCLPGKPDIVLKKYKSVIFVHGCFWHGHDNCKNARIPKSNVEFWTTKIKRNKERFAEVKRELELMGWKVLVIWECELKKNTIEETMRRLVSQIQ
ncbi:MAG: very short patch repair endonuclease [Alphaproteobacteria bacterium]|nr:very short patch repair endonuclease [Alphaproteobacteria bacterium]